ncbi:alpha/beta fold hydrolase [Streptomyces sp. NPDC005389]|uniref:alpha/beta hydrolase n=1 Tax=Streptomyces sp. NPDC005389 TaxID=3157040 RepID=UPI0033B9C372
MNDTERTPEFLLVHGAWHRSWCWSELQDALSARGWTSHTVDLPSVVDEGTGGRLPGLLDDARVIREKIAAIEGPVVVVGHSYGGAPVTQATAGAADVAHVVYVAAFALDEGESLTTCFGGEQPDLATVEASPYGRTRRRPSTTTCPRTSGTQPSRGCCRRPRSRSPSR